MSNLDISRAQRLDQYVVGQLPRLSRGHATKLIVEGRVAVNGQPQTKPGYKPRFTDTVEIDFDEAILDTIPNIELPIIYEDDDCLVINKPAGVLTHGKGAFDAEATVATWLRQHIAEASGFAPTDNRAGVVHRLDRLTSGVMICAKSAEALSWLTKQFGQRRVKKTYSAVISGQLEPAEAIIDMPLERNPKAPATFRVGANGKSAITHYVTQQTSAHYSLLELKPETGRTHQLRVHLAHQKHPIVGDPLYHPAFMNQPIQRMYLHAHTLELTLPNRQRQLFTVPIPEEFAQLIQQDKDAA